MESVSPDVAAAPGIPQPGRGAEVTTIPERVTGEY